MDPSENIKRQRELAQEVPFKAADFSTAPSANDLADLQAAALELAELVIALDEWRLKGGYDPYEADGHGDQD